MSFRTNDDKLQKGLDIIQLEERLEMVQPVASDALDSTSHDVDVC